MPISPSAMVSALNGLRLYSRRVDQAAERIKDLNEKVRPMVVEKPYPSLAVALAAGFVLGALLMGRGPKVIYVKPRL